MSRLARQGLGWLLASPVVTAVLLGIVCVAVWWSNTYELNAALAMRGFSPVAWVYQTMHPGDFVLDFPGGLANYRLSAFMHVYLAAYRVGISPEALLPYVVGLEIVFLGYALFALSRVLVADAPPIIAALVIIFAIASTARDVNLANFPEPFILGLYYNVANALRILGIVMILKNRPLPAAMLFAGSFATHPAMALSGMVCGGVMLLTRPSELLSQKYLAAAGAFVLLAGGWLGTQFGSATISSSGIPLPDWMEMTRLLNAHWYTPHLGLFTVHPGAVFLPFLSFLLLLLFYFPGGAAGNEVTRKVAAGLLALLGLVVAGIGVALWVPVPFLIKLALHRSNDLVLVIGLPYVLAGLWRDLTAGPWWRPAVAATVLLSPWFARPYPLLVSVVLVSPAWLRVIQRRPASVADRVISGLVVCVVLLVAVYLAAGVSTHLSPRSFFGAKRSLLLFALFILVLTLVARWRGHQWAQGLALVAVMVLALSWLTDKVEGRDVTRERDYLQAQEWAREYTPSSALFMTDPTIFYGWRDYSRRSSFGNLREWLHFSWLYDTSFEAFQEGMRRFGEFNIDLEPYLRTNAVIVLNSRYTTIEGNLRLEESVRRRYYDAPDEWRTDLARRYRIDFFVFERRNVVKPTSLKVVYENEHFTICATGQ
jgi:hypothetical protein